MQTIEITLYTAAELKEQFPKSFERALAAYADHWDDPWSYDRNKSMEAVLKVLGCPDLDVSRPRYGDSDGLTGLALYNAIRNLKRDDFYPTGYADDLDFAEAAVSEYERGARTGRRCAHNFESVWGSIAEREMDFDLSNEGFLDHCEANKLLFTASGEQY